MSVFVSHLIFSVSSAAAGVRAFESLGFQVTPLRRNATMGDSETTPAGSSLVLFPSHQQVHGNYIEIANIGENKPAPFMQEILSNPPAAKMICCYTDEMPALLDKWRQLGLEIQYNFEASSSDDGALGANKFKIAIPKLGSIPVTMDVIEFASVQPYKNTDFCQHPNDATFLSDIYCLLPEEDLEAVAARYCALLQGESSLQSGVGQHICVYSGDVSIHFFDVEAMQSFCACDTLPAIAGIGLRSADIERTRHVLTENGVGFQEQGTRIIVGPTAHWNAVVTFTA